VVRAGLGLVAAGLIQASAGEATTVTRTLTIIIPTIITPWLTQMGILAFCKAPSTEGAIAESLKAAAQAHRSGPARRCRRSKKAAWAAVQPTMSTAGTASGHLGMPRTRLDHKLRCHAAERVLHGLLVDGREESSGATSRSRPIALSSEMPAQGDPGHRWLTKPC
jgi:hypothetical protein